MTFLRNRAFSATEQYRLGEAVKGYNEITGDSVSITNAATGELSKSTDEIDKNAAAWKRNAEMKALSNAASKYLQQEVEAEGKLEIAQAKVTEAQKANTAAVNESTEYYKKHKEQIDKAMTSKTTNEYTKKWGQLKGEVTKTGQALEDAQGELERLAATLRPQRKRQITLALVRRRSRLVLTNRPLTWLVRSHPPFQQWARVLEIRLIPLASTSPTLPLRCSRQVLPRSK